MNQPPLPPKPHMCFSGSLACSGCAPCDACLHYVRTYVLPPAMGAAGFAGDAAQAQRFFEAYTQQGWPRLQEAMHRPPHIPGPVGDPGLLGHFAVNDVSQLPALLKELEVLRAEAHAQNSAPAVAPFSPGMPGVMATGNSGGNSPSYAGPNAFLYPMGPPVPSPLASGASFATVPSGTGFVHPPGPYVAGGSGAANPAAPTINAASPTGSPVVSPRASEPALTEEMDAEDIAAASLPASRGVSLGNVMTVPPGMEHHLDIGKETP